MTEKVRGHDTIAVVEAENVVLVSLGAEPGAATSLEEEDDEGEKTAAS